MSRLSVTYLLQRKWLLGAVLVLLLLLLAFLNVSSKLYQPISITNQVTVFNVEPGSSLTRVANELAAMDFIESPLLLSLYARLQGNAGSIQSGEYEISDGITPVQLLEKMVQGETVQYRITLVEGWTLEQALNEIWDNSNIEKILTGNSAGSVADQLGLEYESAEGLFFPDTYFFNKGDSDREILRRANQRLDEVLAQAWESRLGALPYDDPYDALILASIIEKESAEGSERGHIAGVFVRRLEQGMRLQSDPTVIYGMGDSYDGDIRREDLLEETAFNTYRINGLPPTPIALAGIESIEASLNPLPSDFLYFVSRGDGTHYFSSTLEEHNAAVNRFQLQPSTQ